MPQNQTSHLSVLQLNGQTVVRTYTAEIKNVVTKGSKTEHAAVVIFFTLQYLGTTKEGNLKYKSSIQRRLFLDHKNRPIVNHSKAQKIAFSVAKINDELIFEVTKNYKLIGILNTEEVQEKWKAIKNVLLESFVDLKSIIAVYDWQMQTNNIQEIYKNDIFYTFFFSNFFYQEFNDEKSLEHHKTIANGIHNLHIPVMEQKKITKQDMLFQNIEITTTAELEVSNKLFPLEKINRYLGSLLGSIGSKHNLNFNYQGLYTVKPRIGLITGGKLEYEFKIEGIYQKTTTINFNLENHEY